MKKTKMEQVRSGLRMGLGSVAGICIGTVLIYGVQKVRSPNTDESLFTFLKPYPPRVVGIVCIVLALAILWMTMPRWISMLAGLFGYAVFGGSLAIANGGWHPPGMPSQDLTRGQTVLVTALFAACSVLTLRFRDGSLTLPDRIGVLAATLCFAYGATSPDSTSSSNMMIAMVLIFLAMTAVDRLEKWRSGRRPRRHVPPPQQKVAQG